MGLFRHAAVAVAAIGALAYGLSAAESTATAARPAPSGIYFADPAHTSVTWSVNHVGLSHWTARFVEAQAVLDWRPEAPERSTLTVRIEPRSVRTDYPWPAQADFDGTLAESEDFFAGRLITFASTRVEVTGERTGRVHGDLTLRGQTHPAVLEVVFNGSMAEHPVSGLPKVGFSATGTIRRSDWGMVALLPAIGDEVTIAIEAQLGPEAG